jgi:DNA-binding CsgD family transcriptional regulator
VDIKITTNQRRCLELAAEGLSYFEIADAMFLSEGTIRTHMGKVQEAFDVKGRHRMVAFAQANGILPYPPTGQYCTPNGGRPERNSAAAGVS